MHRIFLFFLLSLIVLAIPAEAKKTKEPSDLIQSRTKGLKKYSGFYDFYWDENTGSILLEVDRWDEEFIYLHSLSAGVGSNDLGLDRGQIASPRVVKFLRSGPKVLLQQPNYDYRATTDNPLEERAVEEAFASSVLWGFKVEAESGDKVLIDITDFLIRDAHGVGDRLSYYGQGNYKADPSRSSIYLERTKNFPKNSEFESMVTLTGSDKGYHIRSVTPYPKAVTVRNHHSFIQLPDEGYEERNYDVRSGFMYLEYQDFGTRIQDPIIQRKILRHRLKIVNGEIEEPIIYYLDKGAPEPIRGALLEGASWWAQAFTEAGFPGGFQVKLLPDTVDPLDVRYNVIQWIHRSTRGWSYGNSIIDPRTGEIIKGHVSLGSQRVRQDYLIAVGLLGPYGKGKENEAVEMALARLRQLSAHEVGHTLGLMHNFAASVNNRASVMDYPHPLIRLNDDGEVDLKDAYDTGVGEWDIWSIRYGYTNARRDALDEILQGRISDGIQYISDNDARPWGGSHGQAHLWDNGESPERELERILQIRKVVLEDFDLDRVRPNEPVATIGDALVPIYFMHRYQLEANTKLIGGERYAYAVKGDNQDHLIVVDANSQKKAIHLLVKCLRPEELSLPENIFKYLPPRPPGYESGRENFNSRNGMSFDPVAAAEALADRILLLLLRPERAGRMEQYHASDPAMPGFSDLMNDLISGTWKAKRLGGTDRLIQEMVEKRLLYRTMGLASDADAHESVRSIAHSKVMEIKAYCNSKSSAGAHYRHALFMIVQYENDPSGFEIEKSPSMPDGSPIGMGCMDFFGD